MFCLQLTKANGIRTLFEDAEKNNAILHAVARDVPGGKRILIIKINAQHNALSKAI